MDCGRKLKHPERSCTCKIQTTRLWHKLLTLDLLAGRQKYQDHPHRLAHTFVFLFLLFIILWTFFPCWLTMPCLKHLPFPSHQNFLMLLQILFKSSKVYFETQISSDTLSHVTEKKGSKNKIKACWSNGVWGFLQLLW